MAKIEDLKAKVAAATARAEQAAKDGDAEAEARAVDEEEAAQAELLGALKIDRRLRGKRAERAAKAAACGRYQVGHMDFASLLPQLDAEKMPNSGVVVFRSPDGDARKRHELVHAEDAATIEQKTDANITLICDCTVDPQFKVGDPAAQFFRRWWETEGRGVVALASLHVQKLGGFQLDAFKRAT